MKHLHVVAWLVAGVVVWLIARQISAAKKKPNATDQLIDQITAQ